ncbi:MAG: aminopeptidase P family protein [Thermomicrobiaceae bacterium]|nr:aminopeptidase P family protein [Thermomicrobiaceae bacterium]
MSLGEAFHQRAVRQIAERLSDEGKHALLVFDPASVRYLTGLAFAPGERPLAVAVWHDARAALLVPRLEAEHAAQGWIKDVRWYEESPATESPVRWMAREVGGPLIVDHLPAAEWQALREEAEDAALDDLVAPLRAVKTPPELTLVERAAEYADLALERAFARLTSGTAERDVLADVLHAVDAIMRDALGDLYDPLGPAIAGSVQSGVHAAMPAMPTSARRLARGDTVIVEFTASVGGYHARSGCTFFVGDPLRDVVSWVEAAMHAQRAAREALALGATPEAVDRAAREVLERNGLGDGIRHRTGQGIGLARAEAPWLALGQEAPLQAGMVVVLQPGVYVPGRVGTRNAETVVLEEDGPRVLNPRLERWATLESRLKEF